MIGGICGVDRVFVFELNICVRVIMHGMRYSYRGRSEFSHITPRGF